MPFAPRRVARRTARRTSRRQMEMYEASQPQQQAPPPAAPPPAPAPAAPTQPDYAQLQQLATLHEQGVLTDAEFEAKKKEILGI